MNSRVSLLRTMNENKQTWIILRTLIGEDLVDNSIGLVKATEENAVMYLGRVMAQCKHNDENSFKCTTNIFNSNDSDGRQYSGTVYFEDYEVCYSMRSLENFNVLELD